jgi:hypothetical protein
VAIVNFRATIVMNVITYFGVVSLYRDSTSRGVSWSNIDGAIRPRDAKWLRKYRERGYAVVRSDRHIACSGDCDCPRRVRSIFDNCVGVVKFADYAMEDTTMLLRGLQQRFIWQLNGAVEGLEGCGKKGFIISNDEYYTHTVDNGGKL